MTKPTIRQIQNAVCNHFRIGRRDMLSESRMRHLVDPRHIAIALSRKIGGRSYPMIGREFGRDHSSIINACQRIEARIDAGSSSTIEAMAEIEAALGREARI